MYGKEQTEQEAKIAAMREDDSKDEYDVRKQEEVLKDQLQWVWAQAASVLGGLFGGATPVPLASAVLMGLELVETGRSKQRANRILPASSDTT